MHGSFINNLAYKPIMLPIKRRRKTTRITKRRKPVASGSPKVSKKLTLAFTRLEARLSLSGLTADAKTRAIGTFMQTLGSLLEVRKAFRINSEVTSSVTEGFRRTISAVSSKRDRATAFRALKGNIETLRRII